MMDDEGVKVGISICETRVNVPDGRMPAVALKRRVTPTSVSLWMRLDPPMSTW